MKSNRLRYAVIIILPLAVYFGSTFFYSQTYYNQSLEGMKMCYEHNPDTQVCSYVTTASDRAFNLAASFYQPTLIMLIVALVGIAANNIQMRNELNEIKEKLDV